LELLHNPDFKSIEFDAFKNAIGITDVAKYKNSENNRINYFSLA